MSRIGDALRRERKACGMILEVLAEQAEISVSYTSEVERGTRIPRPETVLRLANVFPDVDSTAWLWLLLRDSWGDPIAAVMIQHARATSLEPQS